MSVSPAARAGPSPCSPPCREHLDRWQRSQTVCISIQEDCMGARMGVCLSTCSRGGQGCRGRVAMEQGWGMRAREMMRSAGACQSRSHCGHHSRASSFRRTLLSTGGSDCICNVENACAYGPAILAQLWIECTVIMNLSASEFECIAENLSRTCVASRTRAKVQVCPLVKNVHTDAVYLGAPSRGVPVYHPADFNIASRSERSTLPCALV